MEIFALIGLPEYDINRTNVRHLGVMTRRNVFNQKVIGTPLNNFKISTLFVCSVVAISVEATANPIILAVGDSITAGFSSQPSYREELDRRLEASGCTPIWLGSQSDGHPEPHEGYSGHRVEDFLSGTRGNNPGIESTMTIYDDPANGGPVETVLMHLGTNDMLQSQSVSSTLTEIQEIIDIVHLENSSTQIFIANVVPWYDTDSDGDGVKDLPNFNTSALSSGIDAAYSNYSGAGVVHLVDVRTGFRPTDMVADGIHPSPDDPSDPRSDSGEHHLAVAFAAALEAEGTCNPTSSDTSFPLTNILTPVVDDIVNGPVTITGIATDTGDTGGDAFNRVRLAIQDNNFTANNNRWWNFNNSEFGSFNSIDAHIFQETTNYADWQAGFSGDPGQSGQSINLPSGDYTLFALAIDNAGNQNYFNTELWPERTRFSVTDSIGTCNGLNVTVSLANGDVPTSGSDVILGTSGSDIINAFGGDDTICGLGGNDVINAGGGNDWVDGGSGDDEIRGSAGVDTIFGGTGNDEILGGTGDDDIEGEEGDDRLFGQPGNDTLDGGDGVDAINGGSGNDIIFTGSGATVNSGFFVSGGGGNDVITGGPDADHLIGSFGIDTIFGAAGNDLITGGNGADELNGGSGDDDIRGQGQRDIIAGGDGDDTITGGDGNDEVDGGPGDDEINGNGGSDLLLGGGGNDALDGGLSAGDECNGQTGLDTAAASCEIVTNVP